MPVRPAIIPCLRYTDAPAAIEFLCTAFGFERHAVHANPDDAKVIEHAQLVRGGQMIMLGSVKRDAFAQKAGMTTVAAAGGVSQSIYVVVDDVDAVAARAEAAGAETLMPPTDQDYGGRNFTARDPEGYIWSFGSYDPWATPA